MTAAIRIIPAPIDWQHPDRGAVRDALAATAEAGYTHVECSPPWHLLQPTARTIDSRTMQLLETLVDDAAAVGLRSVVHLLQVRDRGVLTLPDWHHGPDAVGFLAGRTRQPVRFQGIPVRIDGRLRTLDLADPYRTESWRDAQLLLVHTVVGYYGSHPAITHWHLADGWSRLADTSAAHAAAWLRGLTEAARRAAPAAHLVATVDAPNLLGHALIVGVLAGQFDVLQVDAAMPEIPHRDALRLSTPPHVLHDLVAALARRPVIVRLAPTLRGDTRGWRQTTWHQQPLVVAQLSDEDSERYAQAVVAALQPAGAAGVVFPQPPAPSRIDPQQSRIVGNVLRGWETCVAAASTIDAERFLHNPLRGFQMLWKDV
jgi:hypothetical protein